MTSVYREWSSASVRRIRRHHQPDDRPGARFWHDEEDPTKASGAYVRGPEERVQHVMELLPEIVASTWQPQHGRTACHHTPTHLKTMALAIKDACVTPELEVFETGHCCCQEIPRKRTGEGPGLFQIASHPMGQPATAGGDDLHAEPSAGGLHVVCLRHFALEFRWVAQAVLLGGHPRVGMEDNIYSRRAARAVERGARREGRKIIRDLGSGRTRGRATDARDRRNK